MKTIRIRKSILSDKDDIIQHIKEYKREFYPMLDTEIVGDDLLNFADVYIYSKDSVIYVAIDELGDLIGTIGFVNYNNRLKNIQYSHMKVVEIVKLYVKPHYRKFGIGSQLFDKLYSTLRKLDYKIAYLHTHPFLPGAVYFWQKKGFVIILNECYELMDTIHMEKLITP